MLIPALAALVLFAGAEPAAAAATAEAAPAAASAKTEATPAAAAAKPEMRRVCEKVEVANSKAPKKVCRMVPA